MPLFDRPTLLMCAPDHYGIEYEINPWMSRSRGSDTARARAQWQALHDLVISLGAVVELLPPEPGLPDLVFTANAGLVVGETVYVSRFRHPPRQGESAIDEQWFQARGFETVTLPEGMDFEGAGDALYCGETLFGGYIIRSDASAMQWVAGRIGCRVIPLQLVDDHYYHLDTCFCPLSPTEAIWYPPAFDEYAQRAVQEHVATLIAVQEDEAARFACNAVVLPDQSGGRGHVVLNDGCSQLSAALEAVGYTPHATPLDEFIKAGGSAKCLTLRLDGENAAIWNPPSST